MKDQRHSLARRVLFFDEVSPSAGTADAYDASGNLTRVGMPQDKGSAKIVHSIIELAHNLDLSVVAEGVEDLETLDRLGTFGCGIAQGYSISRPLSAKQFRVWEVRSAGD